MLREKKNPQKQPPPPKKTQPKKNKKKKTHKNMVMNWKNNKVLFTAILIHQIRNSLIDRYIYLFTYW